MTNIEYHLAELAIARDRSRAEHLLPDLSGCRRGVVDVGCGIGQLFAVRGDSLSPGVARFAFDVDAQAISYAKERWPDLALFAVAPAERLPLPDRSVDLFVSRATFPLVNIPAALSEAARVLVPGGRLWVSLHSMSRLMERFGVAVRDLSPWLARLRGLALLNGIVFHFAGARSRIGGVHDSWQSDARMRRELKRVGFEHIESTLTDHHFVIEAVLR